MTTDESKASEDAPQEEEWVEVGNAPKPPVVATPEETPAEETFKVYEGRKPVPPWKLSAYTGLVGLILMALLYVASDLRHFNAPWNPTFPTVYVVFVFPAFGILWGIIALLGKPFREDRPRALIGLVVSIAAGVVGYGALALDETPEPAGTTEVDQRLNMTPQELQEWRQEKLNR